MTTVGESSELTSTAKSSVWDCAVVYIPDRVSGDKTSVGAGYLDGWKIWWLGHTFDLVMVTSR